MRPAPADRYGFIRTVNDRIGGRMGGGNKTGEQTKQQDKCDRSFQRTHKEKKMIKLLGIVVKWLEKVNKSFSIQARNG